VRFTFQSFLATRNLPGDATLADRLLQKWEEALATLRGVMCARNFDADQVRSYSTCSNNLIFNDPASAILSEALLIYLGAAHLTHPRLIADLSKGYQAYPSTFWVALCACVLGDPELLETCMRKLASMGDINTIPQNPSDPSFEQLLVSLLRMAIEHMKPRLVNYILERHSSMISAVRTDFMFLRTAICANDGGVLKALLGHIPNSPDLLTDALKDCGILLPRSRSGSDTIRLLARHFAPLSAESRAWLIMHSCSVGDVRLLEEFSNTGSLFEQCIRGAREPMYINFAISYGNTDSLRFLLGHGVLKHGSWQQLRMAVEQALGCNQIDCYRELYPHFDDPLSERGEARSAQWFTLLGLAANSEDFMADSICKDEGLILETFGDRKDPRATLAQRALWNSINRLRPENIQLLLNEGVRALPYQNSWNGWSFGSPFEILWPYFNQNRDAFARTQVVLDAFGLPKLSILV
jgi:hypothetical protein